MPLDNTTPKRRGRPPGSRNATTIASRDAKPALARQVGEHVDAALDRATRLANDHVISGGKSPKEAIQAPNLQVVTAPIVGASPFMQHRFSEKGIKAMEAKHRAGSQARKGQKRDPRDFESEVEAALHVSTDGWIGIPAPAFRSALISSCRLVGFKMTIAKLSLFVLPDGYDAVDGTPLVRIYGDYETHKSMVRNETGVVDIRWRPMWRQWSCKLRLRFDADQFSAHDVLNLLRRAGTQVGVGEGRPDSPNSNGQGFGLFDLAA